MQVALEDLTPEAQAAAARLHPKVKEYLEAKAGKAAADNAERATAKKQVASRGQDGQRSASRSDGGPNLDDAARFERQLDRLTPGGGLKRSSAGARLVTAFFVGVFVLEALSYILGQPFTYNLKGAAAKLGNLSKTPYVPLFQGQQAPTPLPSHGL